MPIRIGDRVTVAGMAGVHTVKDQADVLYPSHKSYLITLGYAYGRQLPGDTASVEAWRCHRVPTDAK